MKAVNLSAMKIDRSVRQGYDWHSVKTPSLTEAIISGFNQACKQ